eukprot:754622-Hanusia_phi.AAC.1
MIPAAPGTVGPSHGARRFRVTAWRTHSEPESTAPGVRPGTTGPRRSPGQGSDQLHTVTVNLCGMERGPFFETSLYICKLPPPARFADNESLCVF